MSAALRRNLVDLVEKEHTVFATRAYQFLNDDAWSRPLEAVLVANQETAVVGSADCDRRKWTIQCFADTVTRNVRFGDARRASQTQHASLGLGIQDALRDKVHDLFLDIVVSIDGSVQTVFHAIQKYSRRFGDLRRHSKRDPVHHFQPGRQLGIFARAGIHAGQLGALADSQRFGSVRHFGHQEAKANGYGLGMLDCDILYFCNFATF